MFKVTIVLALALAQAQSTASPAQTAADAAIKAAVAPAECVTVVRAFVSKRQGELRPPTGITIEAIRQVDAEKIALAKSCAARYDVKTVAPKQLAGLSELYAEATQLDLATMALDRALTSQELTPAEQAELRVSAIRTILREPKSAERNARLEKLVDELDANTAATIEQKLNAHQSLEGYYRADDIDAGIIKHAKWMAQAGKAFTPEQRKRWGDVVVQSQVNMAEALAGQGLNDDALTLLRRTQTEWTADVPRANEFYIAPEIARLELVGTPASALTATRWLNMPAGKSELDMKGSVTLLEFSAWWCGPCKESYPGLGRLRAKFGSQGFRVVLATQLYGYFESEGMPGRTLPAETEFERDREYFKHYGLDVPIAVGDRPAPATQKPDGTRSISRDPNDDRYKVGGIPQIHLIDKQGRIRLVMVGYDDANEEKLATMIAAMLKEK